jgi:glycosyltransferase involved in cell wall biosynthesis
MRIALFTSLSPDSGGGSVQLRSHLEHMPELDVRWHYLAEHPTGRKDCYWLGKPLSGLQLYSDFAVRTGFLPGSKQQIRRIVEKLDADLYWVVGHYEGISVADELLLAGKPVHLTIHDEPLAMLIRSRRYRALWPLLRPTFARVLRGAQSVDVTSTKMRDYLNEKYGMRCFAVYKYVPALPVMKAPVPGETVRIGHIGSLYQAGPFRQFVLACREFAARLKRSVTIVRIGTSPQMDEVAAENLVRFENHGELPEEEALPILASCDFSYAMYPDGFRFEGFRRTSLPIKLSTYIQAQRPIFAHTPPDSGLAELVSKFKVGLVCSSDKPEGIRGCLENFWEMRIECEPFEELRKELMGREQVEQLRQALTRASTKSGGPA